MPETLLNGRYKIIQTLGSGGFGQTYLVEDTQHVEPFQCVIKQFKPISQDPNFLQIARRLFDTEVQTLRRLGSHDQIPALLNYFEENQEFYLVQEFIAGTPLSKILSYNRQLDEAQVIVLLEDVLEVLEFVHTNQVIHRDIKPANLIKRQDDGKFVLIDFGAVKQIQTQLMTGSGQTEMTVGIGTQGYMPSEQVMGKPRLNSDIYALGMTAIQALTGRSPGQLPEDPTTAELIWRDLVQISDPLAAILSKMVRYNFSQRYQSASEVLRVLRGETALPNEITAIPPTEVDENYPATVFASDPTQGWKGFVRFGVKIVAIASLTMTGLVLGVRQLGGLQPLELAAFDRMMQLRGDMGSDPRLLVVAITEADIQAQKQFPLSDQTVAQVLARLQQYQPRVIGLDLYRDVPQEPGHADLAMQLKATNVITINNIGDTDTPGVPPPPGVSSDRVGFNDLVKDPDGVIRRSLIFANTDTADLYSFAMRVALAYLAKQSIAPKNAPDNPQYMQLGNAIFQPLDASSGGYQTNDSRGFQILLNYRSPEQVAQRISVTQVLNGSIKPEWVKDKVVLIGTTAASAKDLFYTPYSPILRDIPTMPGVVVHAQMVSQLLSAALEGQSVFWFWSDAMEIFWILTWSILGALLAWQIRHPLLLGTGGTVLLIVLMGVSFGIFTRQGWVPVMAPALAATLSGGVVIAYRAQQNSNHRV